MAKQAHPTKRQIANARRRLKREWSLIVLHSFYQRIGLPTKLLAPLYGRERSHG